VVLAQDFCLGANASCLAPKPDAGPLPRRFQRLHRASKANSRWSKACSSTAVIFSPDSNDDQKVGINIVRRALQGARPLDCRECRRGRCRGRWQDPRFERSRISAEAKAQKN
jgi:hypothetical protein